MNFFSNSKTEDRREAELKASMTEPFIPEFSDYVGKVRRNCLAVSTLALVMIYADVKITSNFNTNGFSISGLDDWTVKAILLLLTGYWLAHFIWCAVDYFYEWRIRLSGIKEGPYTWDASESDATPADRNFSMLRWVYFKIEDIRSFQRELEKIKIILAERQGEIDQRAVQNIESGIRSLQNMNIQGLNDKTTNSIYRFDNWWKFMARSQSLRWITLELSLPIILGITALFSLSNIVFFTKAAAG